MNNIRAKVIGIGNAGNTIIRELAKSNNDKNIEYQNINTDMATYSNYRGETPSFIIGKKITKGLGCRANPELGEKAVEESREEIIKFLKKELQDIDIVFLVTCLGEGCGTGATPLIANIIREELRKLVVGIVTIPFYFEGKKRFKVAINGLEKMKQNVDVLVATSNADVFNGKRKMIEAFKEVDKKVSNIVQELYEAINTADIKELNEESLKQIILRKGSYITLEGDKK